MTNKEIKQICIKEQKRVGGDDYPSYNFRITQDEKYIKIYWGYLDSKEYWTIDRENLVAFNEWDELMNYHFDFYGTLEEIIKSCVYYMVTRY